METQVEKSRPIIIERIYRAPISRVWNAITDIHEMRQWYFDIQDFKPEIGFEFQFFGGNEKKLYLHLCKITEVIVDTKLTYSWRYDGYPGNSFVTFELFSEGDKTRLKLSHSGLESFPRENPDMAKENFVEGWSQLMGTYLKKFVEKNSSSVVNDHAIND
jgi:uncharacterized protein YndB with AHSA1/START domain